jgi:uncharacterized protein (TIGR03437 family)
MQLTHGPVAFTALLRLVPAALLICLTPQASPSQTPPPQVITHEGPLVLKGSQVYTIENVTFIQHGPIEVHDQAQLVIRDSTVEFQQAYHEELQWKFQGMAQLIVERSTVNSPYMHTTAFWGSARARVDNSTFANAFMTLTDTASVSLHTSTVRHVSVDSTGSATLQLPSFAATDGNMDQMSFWLKGDPSGTVRGLHPGQRLSWSLTELANARMSVQLTNTWVRVVHWRIGGNGRVTFDDCDISQLGAEDNAVVSVRNSRVSQAVMVFERSHHVALRGLTAGRTISHWSLRESDPATDVPFDYIIDNSLIGGWHLRVRGDLTLEDCDLRSRLRPEFNTSSSVVRVIRTSVEDLMLWWSYGTVAFEDSRVGFVDNPAESTVRITGTVRFEKKVIDTANGPWRQATVTRQFPVRVLQTNGAPLAALPLRLYDPGGKEVWSGQTGADGQASFEIAFTDTNYDKTWSLRFGTSEPAIAVPVRFLSDTPLVPPIPLNSPAVDSSALRGKYQFVQLLVSAPASETRTLAGALDFDGKGAYTYTAEGTPGGKGAYWVGGAGSVALVSPIRNVDWLSAYLSADGDVLIGASTFAADTNYDFFVAVRAPLGNVTNALLNGSYSGGWLEFAPGATPVMKSGLVSLVAGGTGQFSRVALTGHASDQGGRTANQSAAGATYNLKPDGRGTASFGTAASLLSGDREIFVSKDGTYLVGHLPGRGALVAAKSAGAGADFEGRYWIAGLSVDGLSWSAASGSLRTLGANRALVAERRRLDERALDYAGLRSYAVNPDGTGALAPSLPKGLANLGLVAPVGPVEAPRAGAFVGTQIGPLNESTTQYGIFFGVRAPAFHATGVFLDPAGVVNGASFAGLPYPLAPGAIVSLFGSNLATREARATTFPLPTKLDDVTVTVNGTAAPLYFVSPTQASIQLPYGIKGNWGTLRASNSRGASNEVVAPLAATSPGVFSRPDGRPVVLHADYSLVSPQNPARPGETVMIWLTGLGELSPAVAMGDANPVAPLARAVDAPIKVLFGGVPAMGVDYAGGAPGFAGLCQINATIPANAPPGSNVPLAISTANAHAELVEIPISR